MVKSDGIIQIAIALIFSELTVGLVLHFVGLSLLLTAGKPTIPICLIIKLSIVEMSHILYEGFIKASMFIENGDLTILSRTNQTVLVFLYSNQFLTLIAITVDRLFAVKLALRYKRLVTRRSLVFLVICIWIVSSTLALVLWLSHDLLFNKMLVALECLLTSVYLYSYGYITYQMKLKKKQFHSEVVTRMSNIKVPSFLVLTLICFYLIPDLILAVGYPFSIWFLPVFYLNNITDALIYIIGMPMCRKRIRTLFCRTKITPLTNPENAVGQIVASAGYDIAHIYVDDKTVTSSKRASNASCRNNPLKHTPNNNDS